MGTLKYSIMQESVSAVKALLNDSKMNFVMIGYHLRKIDVDKLYRETGHENIWDFAKDQFGLSKSSASRFMAINERFSVGGYSDRLAEEYKEFSVSQMSEMLPLTDEQISSIDSNATIREIRNMKPKKKEQPKESVMVVATSQQTELQDECSDCDLYHNKEAGGLECNPECGEYACMLPDPDEDENDISQQEGDASENPEYFTVFDVKRYLDREERNLKLCSDEDIRDEIRKHTAANVAAYKKLLSVMDEADEVLKLSHFANAFYIEGDYGSADFYLYNARMVLNESQNFEKVNRPKVDEFVKLQDLPTMKNNDQRGAFIDDYQSWPLWIETPETGERIFRFNIAEDIAIAVRDQKQHLWIPGKYKYSTETEYAGERYYLLGISSNYGVKGAEFKKSQEKTFSESLTNRSNLIEFLKKYQKGEVK